MKRLTFLILFLFATAVGTAQANSATLATGQIDHAGTVNVYLNPDSAVYSTGAEHLVAAVPTDVAGHFMIPAEASSGLLQAAIAKANRENDGFVNFDLIAQANGQLVYYSFSRKFTLGKWIASTDGTPATADVISLSTAPDAPGLMSNPSRRSLAKAATCGVLTTLLSETNAYTTYGELHTGTNQTGWFRYGQTADSDVSVGVSSNNSTWSISGSVHVGNTRSAYEQWNEGGDWGYKVRSSFHYKKYKVQVCTSVSYQIKATQWNGGQSLGSYTGDQDHKCLTTYYQWRAGFYPNSDYERSSQSFANYSGAVSAFGVWLNSKSGSSTNVIQHHHMGSAYSKYWLCGNDNYINYAHRIFAGG